MDFPYPIRFIASDGTSFKVRISKTNKHSWWLKLLDTEGNELKLIKVQKRSSKLFYHDPQKRGGELSGKTIFESQHVPRKQRFVKK